MTLEEEFTLTLAQARSTRGRKWDNADARRILPNDCCPGI
jgi:hypothetical protein